MAGLNFQNLAQTRSWRKFSGNFIARWTWEGRRAWRRLGWSVFAAVGLLAASGVLAWHSYVMQENKASLQKKLLAAQSSLVAKPAVQDNQRDMAKRLGAFYAYLPAHDLIPDQLKQLINLAEKSGVTLMQAEYKPQAEANAEFLRYHIVLPVKADYPKIQIFMTGALRELPTLVLESVVFKRDKIESEEVEARIQFALLVKKPALKGEGR